MEVTLHQEGQCSPLSPPSQATRQFGLRAVTYHPRVPGAHLHAATAEFLASVGLPGNKFFSPRLDLETGVLPRLDHGASLTASLAGDGIGCPPGAERWEVVGGFVFSMVALDPESGMVYALSEGEPEPLLMHADVSSLVYALMVLERGKADYQGIHADADTESHKQRNAVERRINRIKQWRGLLMRTDELASPYPAALHLAALLIRTRR
ncbi:MULTISPECIES: SUKH-4 family immunity protein [unclassified Streptomyces]|uniref:SUKH-4 family immunity protein n=1 Tax=unclassified Streptomyces TaxID=2593676 RepID=UPI0036FC9F84